MSQSPATSALLELLHQRRGGVLVTIKKDGRPQLSNVLFSYDDATRIVRISVTDDRVKTRNLRRDPRASLYVGTSEFNAYLVAEGDAELSPVAADPHDATVEELIAVYRDMIGEHPNWDEYREAMVADRRLVVRLRADWAYGSGPSGRTSGPLD